MQENTWNNRTHSQSLTAANIQHVVDDMKRLSDAAFPRISQGRSCSHSISIRPDVLIVPHGLIESTIYAGRLAVERLVRLLAQPVKRGRFEQRQRRKAQGVWTQRLERRQRLERALVEAIDFLAMFECECGENK